MQSQDLHARFWCKRVEEPQRLKLGAISKIQCDYQNCHIGAWNLELEKTSSHCILAPFVPHGVGIELIFAPQAAVFEIWTDFQIFHIWAWNLEEERPESCICSLFLPQLGRNWAYFRSTGSRFRDTKFQNFHIWTWNLELEEITQSCICTLFLPHGVEIKLRAAVFEIQQFELNLV